MWILRIGLRSACLCGKHFTDRAFLLGLSGVFFNNHVKRWGRHWKARATSTTVSGLNSRDPQQTGGSGNTWRKAPVSWVQQRTGLHWAVALCMEESVSVGFLSPAKPGRGNMKVVRKSWKSAEEAALNWFSERAKFFWGKRETVTQECGVQPQCT